MSIRHIVMWKIAAEDAATKQAHAEEVCARLLGLVGVVPEILDLAVDVNVAYPGQNWDVVLVGTFADVDALERYITNPDHQEVVQFVRSVVSDRAAIDVPLAD